MKKILALFLVLIMVLSLCACGAGEAPESAATLTTESSATEADEPETTAPEEVYYAVGDTVASDSAELVLTLVETEPSDDGVLRTPVEDYFSGGRYIFRSADGKISSMDGTFIFVEFTLKNIGKTDLGPVSRVTASGRSTSSSFDVIPTIDYNDGYIFFCDDVTTEYASYYAGNWFAVSDIYYITDLKPLGKTATARVAIHVPWEVVENKDAPLLIRMSIPSAEKGQETFTYKIR